MVPLPHSGICRLNITWCIRFTGTQRSFEHRQQDSLPLVLVVNCVEISEQLCGSSVNSFVVVFADPDQAMNFLARWFRDGHPSGFEAFHAFLLAIKLKRLQVSKSPRELAEVKLERQTVLRRPAICGTICYDHHQRFQPLSVRAILIYGRKHQAPHAAVDDLSDHVARANTQIFTEVLRIRPYTEGIADLLLAAFKDSIVVLLEFAKRQEERLTKLLVPSSDRCIP
jgi:hypothetical protein